MTIEEYGSSHILVGGNFTKYKNTTCNKIVKLDTSFNIDSSFNTGVGFNNTVVKIKKYKSGFLVSGSFTSYKNTTHNRLVLLDANGNVDTSFNTGTGFDNLVPDFHIQSDLKIVVTGNFININNVTKNGIVRLNEDGSIDSSFNTGSGFPISNYMGSCVGGMGDFILLGGEFNSFNGVSKTRLVLLNKVDGSINQNFNPDYISGSVSTIINYNDKFIIGGRFNRKIEMINIDGTQETSFDVGVNGFNNDVRNLYIKNNALYVSGDYTSYNSQNSNRVSALDLSNGSITKQFNNITEGLVTSSIVVNNNLIVGGFFSQPSVNITKYII